MEEGKVLRKIMEDIDSIMDDSDGDIPQEQIGSDPLVCLKSIFESIKSIADAIKNGTNIDEITSGLHNVSEELKELASSVNSIEECHGTENMGPELQNHGGGELQVYNNPQGSSYPERNGFVG